MHEARTLTILVCVILLSGVFVQIRLIASLRSSSKNWKLNKKLPSAGISDGSVNTLILNHVIVSCLAYPAMLLYMLAYNYYLPMSDYIGYAGCFLLIHNVVVYVTLFSNLQSFFVAIFRYILIVKNKRVHLLGGRSKLVQLIVLLSHLASFFTTLFLQYPISDKSHRPLNLCLGRMETFYDMSDFTKPRETGVPLCLADWHDVEPSLTASYIFKVSPRVFMQSGCFVFTTISFMMGLGIGEIFCYWSCFR